MPAETPSPITIDPETPSKSLLANRANALHSTGPRTPEGKARSARNALRHGLRATLDPALLVSQTEQSDYTDFFLDLRDHLDPQSPLEDLLVERITLLGWKLRRHAQAEARLLDLANQDDRDKVDATNRAAQARHDEQLAHNHRYRIKTAPPPPDLHPLPDPSPAAHLLARYARNPDNPLATLQRYESATERAFYKALIQYRILRTVSPTRPDAPNPADLHHHFHYHRHTEQTLPSSECAKIPNEPILSVPNPPSLPEPDANPVTILSQSDNNQ